MRPLLSQRSKKVHNQKASGRLCRLGTQDTSNIPFSSSYLNIVYLNIFYIKIFHSSKFKSFSYIYNEEQFIAALANDVIVIKSLPSTLKEAWKRKEYKIFKPKNSASPSFYTREILPELKKAKVIGLVLTEGGCLQVSFVLFDSVSNKVLLLWLKYFWKLVIAFSLHSDVEIYSLHTM